MAAHHDPSKIQSHLRELKVLMVEDNELNHLLARVVLKKIGWVLDSAMNGIEALEKLKHNKYDIVLMDIQMPEMDGIEATQRIRTELKATHGQTPIIACSALKLELKKWLEAGMNDYISKPFQSEELMEKVSGLLIKNTISLTDRADGAKENMEQEPVINLQNLYKFSGNSEIFINFQVTVMRL
jgi:two-component system, sensor histidine kinase